MGNLQIFLVCIQRWFFPEKPVTSRISWEQLKCLCQLLRFLGEVCLLVLLSWSPAIAVLAENSFRGKSLSSVIKGRRLQFSPYDTTFFCFVFLFACFLALYLYFSETFVLFSLYFLWTLLLSMEICFLKNIHSRISLFSQNYVEHKWDLHWLHSGASVHQFREYIFKYTSEFFLAPFFKMYFST